MRFRSLLLAPLVALLFFSGCSYSGVEDKALALLQARTKALKEIIPVYDAALKDRPKEKPAEIAAFDKKQEEFSSDLEALFKESPEFEIAYKGLDPEFKLSEPLAAAKKEHSAAGDEYFDRFRRIQWD